MEDLGKLKGMAGLGALGDVANSANTKDKEKDKDKDKDKKGGNQ
jgi:hypothetical protein